MYVGVVVSFISKLALCLISIFLFSFFFFFLELGTRLHQRDISNYPHKQDQGVVERKRSVMI